MDLLLFVQAAKEYHTLLEINNNSLTPGGSRRNARENDLELLRMCKRYQVPVILGSDAHYHKDILNHEFACALLQESDFPEELVVNTDKKKLYAYINKYAQ